MQDTYTAYKRYCCICHIYEAKYKKPAFSKIRFFQFCLKYHIFASTKKIKISPSRKSVFFYLKENVQLIFLCNPQKSGASRVCITFLQVTQKILTKDIFHWLELITEILSFLQTFSVRKTTSRFFKFPKIYMKIDKISYIHGIFWAFKYKITDYSRGYLHSTVSS